jgi:hypothetical protein
MLLILEAAVPPSASSSYPQPARTSSCGVSNVTEWRRRIGGALTCGDRVGWAVADLGCGDGDERTNGARGDGKFWGLSKCGGCSIRPVPRAVCYAPVGAARFGSSVTQSVTRIGRQAGCGLVTCGGATGR